MQIEFLTEDMSGEILVSKVMEKYKEEHKDTEIVYHIKSYKGIGNLKKGGNALDIKSQQLLNENDRKRMKWQNTNY